MAGNKKVFEIHGSVKRNFCLSCDEFYDEDYILSCDGVPYCRKCGGIVKPDVVLYEEPLDDSCVDGAIKAISSADMMIIGGTSLTVYPAANLIHYFKGKYLVLINKTETTSDSIANLVIHDSIGKILQQIV
jgi:NAD-dependent deacetylase